MVGAFFIRKTITEMKTIRLITLLITATLLCGCSSDSDGEQSPNILQGLIGTWGGNNTISTTGNDRTLIVTFNSGMDFFKDKYECDLCEIRPIYNDQTVPVLCAPTHHIYEGLLNLHHACIPRKNYQRICEIDWSSNIEIVGKVTNTSYFTVTGRIPVVSYILSDKYPTLMLIQVDVVRFPKFDISKYINEIICAFVNSH